MNRLLFVLLGLVLVFGAYFAVERMTTDRVDLKAMDFYSKDRETSVVRVRLGNKWALSNEAGTLLTGFEYDELNPFFEKRAVMARDGRYGIVDERSREMVPPKYGLVLNYERGVARVATGGKWGFVDLKGRELVKPDYYDYISAFDPDGLARASNYSKGEDVLLDRSGRVVRKLK